MFLPCYPKRGNVCRHAPAVTEGMHVQRSTHFAIACFDERQQSYNGRRHKKNHRTNGKQKRFKPRLQGRKKEFLCRSAAQLLIDEGFLSAFRFSPILDECGIDLVLFKYIRPRSRLMRIALHIQIKQYSGDIRRNKGIQKHRSRYPNIPIFCISRSQRDVEKIKWQLRDFFCVYFEGTRFYAYVLRQAAA